MFSSFIAQIITFKHEMSEVDINNAILQFVLERGKSLICYIITLSVTVSTFISAIMHEQRVFFLALFEAVVRL